MAVGVTYIATATELEQTIVQLRDIPLAVRGPTAEYALQRIAEMQVVGVLPAEQADRLRLVAEQQLAEVKQWQRARARV